MEIRAVTLFAPPDLETAVASDFLSAAGDAFPYPVQSARLALPPFPDWWPEPTAAGAEALAARWRDAGVDYLSLGPVLLRHDARWLDAVPALLGAGDMVFAAAEIADGDGRVDPDRCRRVARLIQTASRLRPDGFGNLYLAALANCPPGAPFFPVAYHDGGPPAFAIAVEAADLILDAVQSGQSLSEVRDNIIEAVEGGARAITAVADELAAEHRLPFRGVDFSPAPFPTAAQSLGGAMEALGIRVGGPGALFAAAFITEALGRADFHRCGFSGLMLPVLEDNVLAARAAEGTLTISDLLSYAAVCGVGLDTIPLPGDVSQDALAGVLLDVAALAVRLDKPLTARLMPLPGLRAGDPVTFDFPYFANSRVMPLGDAPETGPPGPVSPLTLRPIHH